MARARAKAGMARLRAARVAEGKCGGCGTPRAPGKRCGVCVVRRKRVPDDGVNGEVNGNEPAGGDPWRKDGDGWARYRGQGRRGAPTAATNDEQDLHAALETFERGRAALIYARSPEVEALPRIQKRSVRDEAAGLLALAARFLDEIVDRNRSKGGA